MSSPLQITERAVAGGVVFELSGRLVFDEGTQVVRDTLKAAVAAGVRACLIDLEHVTYMDSGGVGVLVEIYLHVTRCGGRLTLLRPSASARRVLRITHLASVFNIFNEEADALRSLAGGAATLIPHP